MRATSFPIKPIKATMASLAKKHRWYILAGMVFFSLAVLEMVTKLPLSVPCLIKTLTGFECPGCGITRALQSLLRGDFNHAWQHNPLLFFILPAVLLIVVNEFRKTYKQTLKLSNVAI